jgi:hypothetical protein
MSDYAKYLKSVSEELKILQGDITRIIIAKEKEAKEKGKSQEVKKDISKKTTTKEQFQKISLKSMQSVTSMYKDKEEIKKANENPEIDFITKRLGEIFNK